MIFNKFSTIGGGIDDIKTPLWDENSNHIPHL